MSTEQTVTVGVTQHVDASPEQAFDAWLDPAQASHFLFATDSGQMVRAEIDARIGGRFTFTDRRDGVDVEHVGEYVEIDRPRRLVFTFAVPAFTERRTRLAVDIRPRDGGCEVSVAQDGVTPDLVERTTHGWTHILAALGRTVG